MKFSKQKMIDRVTAEGRADMIDDEVRAIMDDLDGQPASTACWERQANGQPVLWVIGKSGKGNYVRESDCV